MKQKRSFIISIIIPTFNNEKHLEETLSSVVTQTHSDWECIVVDDGSTDRTLMIVDRYVQKHKSITFFKRPKTNRKGANSCRNLGALHASGSHLMFLDADDILTNDCVENRLNALNSEDIKYDLYIFNMGRFTNNIGDDDRLVNVQLEKTTNKEMLNLFLNYIVLWPITSSLWNKSFFMKIKFDENLDRFQDVDIHIQALAQNPSINLYPYQKSDSFYRTSTFHLNLDKNKKNLILKSGKILLKKIIRNQEMSSPTGLIVFVCHYCKEVISFKTNFTFLLIYLYHFNFKRLSLRVFLTLFLSNRFLNKVKLLKRLNDKVYFQFRKNLIKS